MTTTANTIAAAAAQAAAPHAKTVVFIHGAWMTPASWDNFRSAFEAAGYKTLAPTWPYLDRPVEDLRAGVNGALIGSLSFKRIVDHYQAIIEQLDEQPILVGHSMGGLITQLLLDRGIGAAGIILDPGPIAGALVGPTSLAAAFPILARVNGWNRPFMLSRDAFHKNFANTLTREESDAAWQAYVVPTSGRIFYQAASMLGTAVNSRARKQPLLVLEGALDRTVTPFVARGSYAIQKKSAARTDYKEFAGRSHAIALEKGWQEVAEYAVGWLDDALPARV